MAIDALTDPDEIALYEQYGPNWRRIIGSGMRDRGGRYGRRMRFQHGIPQGFLTRPTPPQAFRPTPSIDTGAYQKYMQEYNRLMQEYSGLLNQYNQSVSRQNNSYQNTAYDLQQQAYQANFEDAYGGNNPNSSQTNQYQVFDSGLSFGDAQLAYQGPNYDSTMLFDPPDTSYANYGHGGDVLYSDPAPTSYNQTSPSGPTILLNPMFGNSPGTSMGTKGNPASVVTGLPAATAASPPKPFNWGNVGSSLRQSQDSYFTGAGSVGSKPDTGFSWANVGKNLTQPFSGLIERTLNSYSPGGYTKQNQTVSTAPTVTNRARLRGSKASYKAPVKPIQSYKYKGW